MERCPTVEVLAQKAEVEDLQTKLNEQEGALASREKLLQQRLNKMDERKKEMDTNEAHLKGNMQDLQEQQEFFAEQCRELDRKTSAFEVSKRFFEIEINFLLFMESCCDFKIS